MKRILVAVAALLMLTGCAEPERAGRYDPELLKDAPDAMREVYECEWQALQDDPDGSMSGTELGEACPRDHLSDAMLERMSEYEDQFAVYAP